MQPGKLSDNDKNIISLSASAVKGSFLNLLRYAKEEGVKAFISRCVKTFLSPLIKIQKMYFYEYDLSGSVLFARPKVTADFKVATEKNINELSAQMYQGKDEIAQRFRNGKACFVCCVKNRIVSYVWCSFNEEIVADIDLVLKIDKGNAYIYNGRTAPAMRGLGIFTFIYSNALGFLKANGYKRALLSVCVENYPSIRAIEKAGFKRIKEVRYLKFLNVKKYREIKVI